MGCLLIVEQLALLVLVLAVVGTKDVHEVAQLVEARVDALPDALLERFPRLAFRAEAPGSAGARIVRRQQGGAAGVVADRDDLVEHALLELAVLAALADLVDGEHLYLPERLEPLAAGEAAREAVADVAEQEEELLVAAAHAFAQRQLAQHGGEKGGLSRPGRPAQEQGARSRCLRHELVDETASAGERAGPPGAVRPVAAQPQPAAADAAPGVRAAPGRAAAPSGAAARGVRRGARRALRPSTPPLRWRASPPRCGRATPRQRGQPASGRGRPARARRRDPVRGRARAACAGSAPRSRARRVAARAPPRRRRARPGP